MRIRLAENFRALFYAPFYALQALDRMAAHGLDVEWIGPGKPGGAIDGVKDGSIDLTWGGPMRVMKDHDETPDDDTRLLCIGEVVTRDPFCLVGRPGSSDLALDRLPALQMGVVAEVPTPWLCLQADLRDAGIDPAAMMATGQVVRSLTMPQQVEALRAGDLDVVQVFEPYASQAIADGIGRVIHRASGRGPTCYTTFICSRAGLARHRLAFQAVLRALGETQDWIAASGPGKFTRLVKPYFPDLSADVLHAAIEHYRQDGIWSTRPEVSRTGFDRLAASLLQGGFIRAPQTYAQCVGTP